MGKGRSKLLGWLGVNCGVGGDGEGVEVNCSDSGDGGGWD